MGESPRIISPDTVADDLACARCGYNLRTIAAGGRCPECATPVAESIAARDVRAFIRWRRLAWGARLLVWAALLGVVQIICMMTANRVSNPWPYATDIYRALGWVRAFSLPFMLPMAVLLLLSSRPRERARKRPWRLVGAAALLFSATALAYFGFVLWRNVEVARSGALLNGWTHYFAFMVSLDARSSVNLPAWANHLCDVPSIACVVTMMIAGWRFATQVMRDLGKPRLNWLLTPVCALGAALPVIWLVIAVFHEMRLPAVTEPYLTRFYDFYWRHEGSMLLSIYAPVSVCWTVVVLDARRAGRLSGTNGEEGVKRGSSQFSPPTSS